MAVAEVTVEAPLAATFGELVKLSVGAETTVNDLACPAKPEKLPALPPAAIVVADSVTFPPIKRTSSSELEPLLFIQVKAACTFPSVTLEALKTVLPF